MGSSVADDSVHRVHTPPLGPIVRSVLALGAGFIPDQHVHKCNTEVDVRTACLEFAWRVYWVWKYSNRPDRPAPRFHVRKFRDNWKPVYPSASFRYAFECLERTLVARVLFTRSRLSTLPRNLPLAAYRVLHALRNHPEYIIKSADKNMGICVVSRTWYVTQCLMHLSHPRNFLALSAEDVTEFTEGIISQRKSLIMSLRNVLPNLGQERERYAGYEAFLASHAASTACSVPTFYGLIKVHKNPVALRPIVACHSWLTTPVSKVCAHELHRLIRLHLPHVLEDSRTLVRMLESVRIPLRHSTDSVLLITGDVEGLYVNIPIPDAIEACAKFVLLHKGATFASLIRSWLSFVFKNALSRFGERYFLQTWGFAMGTAVAPDAANVYMAFQEDLRGVYTSQALASVLPQDSELLLFARLIDDYTIVISGSSFQQAGMPPEATPAATAILAALNKRAAPHLKITWKVSRSTMDTLDLHVFKPQDFKTSRKLAYRTHQKMGNRYAFLPYTSRHAPGVCRSVIKSEITRHAINCSSFEQFLHMARLYLLRQLHRGFPPELLYKWAAEVDYSTRNQVVSPTPRAESIVRSRVPLFLNLQFDSVTAHIGAPQYLHGFESFLNSGSPFWDRILLCWSKSPSLGNSLICSADATDAAERAPTPNL